MNYINHPLEAVSKYHITSKYGHILVFIHTM